MESSNLSDNKDLYKILAVNRDASADDIISAYKSRLEELNIHNNQEDTASEEVAEPKPEGRIFTNEVADIQSAYNVLINPEQRAEYDKKYSPLVEECKIKESIETLIKNKQGRQNITEVFRIVKSKTNDDILSTYRGGFGNRSFDNTNKRTLFGKIIYSIFRKDLEEMNKNQWHPSIFFIALITSLLAGIGFIMTVRFFIER